MDPSAALQILDDRLAWSQVLDLWLHGRLGDTWNCFNFFTIVQLLSSQIKRMRHILGCSSFMYSSKNTAAQLWAPGHQQYLSPQKGADDIRSRMSQAKTLYLDRLQWLSWSQPYLP